MAFSSPTTLLQTIIIMMMIKIMHNKCIIFIHIIVVIFDFEMEITGQTTLLCDSNVRLVKSVAALYKKRIREKN